VGRKKGKARRDPTESSGPVLVGGAGNSKKKKVFFEQKRTAEKCAVKKEQWWHTKKIRKEKADQEKGEGEQEKKNPWKRKKAWDHKSVTK